MKRIKKAHMPKWMRERPITGRLFSLCLLILSPVLVVGAALYDFRREAAEFYAQAIAVTFLKWED